MIEKEITKLEDFITGTVKSLNDENKEKAYLLIQGMLLAQETEHKNKTMT